MKLVLFWRIMLVHLLEWFNHLSDSSLTERLLAVSTDAIDQILNCILHISFPFLALTRGFMVVCMNIALWLILIRRMRLFDDWLIWLRIWFILLNLFIQSTFALILDVCSILSLNSIFGFIQILSTRHCSVILLIESSTRRHSLSSSSSIGSEREWNRLALLRCELKLDIGINLYRRLVATKPQSGVIDLLGWGTLIWVDLKHYFQELLAEFRVGRRRHQLESTINLCQLLTLFERRPMVHQCVHDAAKSPNVHFLIDSISFEEIKLLRRTIEGRRYLF